MAITAALVKELRDTTGAGMMDAKKALTETDGDMEAAIDWLRTKGLAKAAKKSGRTAAEGLVAVAVKGGKGIAVEVNSETDFVGKNADFQKMVAGIAQVALTVNDTDALKAADMGGKSVEQTVTDAVAVIGENMGVRRMAALEGANVVTMAEVTLVNQQFVVNPDLTVGEAAKEAGVEITGYVRLEKGEGIEVEKEDFAAEVAKMAN